MQLFIDVVQPWFNVVLTLDTDIVSMLCNVENPALDFASFSTTDQRYLNSDQIVKTTLIQSWNVGRVVSLRKLILRNILPATLLTKWNIKVFFKYYTTTFTTPVFANFFWWLLLNFFFPSGFSFMNIHTSKDCRGRGGYFFNSSLPRFRLGLVVSNSSGLQLVSS